ncbi:MAG: tetratricopeptide repeat protein [Deltaproteobacteria bacterium]|nr:tetratricopeptide repeat protein [Deltaproteobacteria bacterium]
MADMFSSSGADAFFSVNENIQVQRSQVAQYAIYKAATYLNDNKKDEALKEFKKALAFDPQNATAHTYIGKIYQGQGKIAEAIREFKTVVQNDRTSVTARNNLGNAYLQAKQYTDAEKEFKVAARMDPINPVADYTLGILYTQTDRFREAETQFNKVARVSPRDGNVPYSMGVLYNKMGRPEDAVKQLEKALRLKKDFPAANYELGAAYAKLGDTEKALEQLSILKSKDTGLANDLSFILNKPKIAYMDAANSKNFNQLLPPGKPLWWLDPTLLFPDTTSKATIAIQFTNEMDLASVINPANWEISRAKSTAGGYYNNTLPVDSSKEALINKRPFSVTYNPVTRLASVVITLQQNSTIDIANGDQGLTIDASHLVFKFTGKDAAGRQMDTSADEVDGYALKPF